ncbi:MAG: amidohydrolase family protein, partial [Planctomycetaceae bacterium]
MINQTAKIALILICIVVAAFAKQPLQTNPQTRPEVFAIVDVNVVPMDREAVLPDQTVMVRDGKIVSITPASEANVPAFATRIDGTGKYLMPGLADMHVHLAHGEEADPDALVVYLAAGVTTVRNMWGQPVHLDWRTRITDGSLLGPNIYCLGPITDGDPPFWAGSSVVRTPDEAAREVAAQKRAGYDGMKVFSNLSPDVYKAILDAARENDFPVYGHVPTRIGLNRALTSGQKSFEHMIDFTYALLPDDSPVHAQLVDMWGDKSKRNWRGIFLDPYEQADRSKIPELAGKAAAAEVWICPTLSVSRIMAGNATEFDKRRSDPTLRYVSPQKRSLWEQRAHFYTSDERNDPAILKRGFETMLIAVKALDDAGARLIVGTDTQNPFVIPGFSVHEELKLFVAAGLRPYEAIKAATHDAAEFVDALDEWGIVAIGQRADLLLLEANPLEDVANTSKQVGVMVRGRWYPKAELQVKLDALAEEYAKMKAEGEATVAIENVNVVPMDREAVLPDQTVMVRDGKIVSIAAASEANVPAFATRIDGTGKYLMPGLADMHVHFYDEGTLLLFVANGVTTVRNLFGNPVHLKYREQIRRGERLGPTIYTSGPTLDGDPPIISYAVSVSSPKAARRVVAEQAAAGYDCIKILNGIQPDVYDAIMEAARRHGIPVVGHVPTDVGLRHVLESRQSSIEHFDGYGMACARTDQRLEGLTDRRRGYFEGWENLDETRFAEIVAATRQAGTWICPTLTIFRQSFRSLEELNRAFKAPEARFLAPDVAESWKGSKRSEALVEAAQRIEPMRERALKKLYDAGVPMLLGTDCVMPNVIAGFSAAQELKYLVEVGLTPYQAIAAGTREAAEFLGASDEFGTVAVGRRADLILVEGNPLEDVQNVAKRAGVMVRGKWFPEEQLQQMLDELAAS